MQSSPNRNHPTAWSRFVLAQRKDKSYLSTCDFTRDFGQLSRWAARYRLAKSFRGLDLGDAYANQNTPQLYSAIVKLFLVYSAFETYCRVIGLNAGNENEVKRLQDSQDQCNIISKIRDLDPQYALSNALLSHLSPALTAKMESFIAGVEVNVSFLAKCVRHIFAHGILSANAAGLSVKRFAQMSDLISNFLLDCMDQDFDARVK